MKKIFLTIVGVLTLMAMAGSGLALADDTSGLTLTKPPIIPEGTNVQTKPATGQIDISTLKLPGVGKDNPQALQQDVIPAFTNIVIGLTGGLSLLFVIIGGIQILTAYGSEEKIGAAKKTITWALAGLLIAILSFAIVQIITSIKI